jgi:hypothetical protein
MLLGEGGWKLRGGKRCAQPARQVRDLGPA